MNQVKRVLAATLALILVLSSLVILRQPVIYAEGD